MRVVEGRATIDDLDEFLESVEGIREHYDATIQVFDARYVVSRAHLERAVELARRERERSHGIARDEAVEILLYAAGRRQIEDALEMGVAEGEGSVVGVVVGGDEAGASEELFALVDPGETLGEYDASLVRTFFSVSEEELAATPATLEDLVLERVALLVVER